MVPFKDSDSKGDVDEADDVVAVFVRLSTQSMQYKIRTWAPVKVQCATCQSNSIFPVSQ